MVDVTEAEIKSEQMKIDKLEKQLEKLKEERLAIVKAQHALEKEMEELKIDSKILAAIDLPKSKRRIQKLFELLKNGTLEDCYEQLSEFESYELDENELNEFRSLLPCIVDRTEIYVSTLEADEEIIARTMKDDCESFLKGLKDKGDTETLRIVKKLETFWNVVDAFFGTTDDELFNKEYKPIEPIQAKSEKAASSKSPDFQQTTILQHVFETVKMFFNYIKQKPQRDIVADTKMEEIIRKAKLNLELDTKNYINIAFVGHTKTGKSSLVNAIRGIHDDHNEAAFVSTEKTTPRLTPYSFPDAEYKNIRIYDIPSVGTFIHDSNSYFSDKCLCAFDCLIIVLQDCLTNEEIEFALQAFKYNQPIAFVRSRCDVALLNELQMGKIDKINQDTATSLLRSMKNEYATAIRRSQQTDLQQVPCFFISSQTLRQVINGEMPDFVFEEQEFLDFIKKKSKECRNIAP